jgi:hypothetical protein
MDLQLLTAQYLFSCEENFSAQVVLCEVVLCTVPDSENEVTHTADLARHASYATAR